MKGLYSFLLFVSSIFFCEVSFASDSLSAPVASKAILDLRKCDLSSETLTLSGEWAFYWNQLLSPDSINTLKPGYTSFPGLWNEKIVDGKKLPARGYATYVLTVLLPEKRKPLALKLPDVYTSYKLFVNGEVFAEDGKPGTSEQTTVPHWANGLKRIPDNTDTLQLVLQIANFSHSKGGANEAPSIGDKDKLILSKDKTMAFDFLVTGCLFMGGLFFFGLYLFGRHDKTILYFSLFCMTYSYRLVGADPYSLHTFIPDVSWWITIRAEYISLYLSIAFFILYLRNLYPLDTNKDIINVMTAICLGFTAFTLYMSPYYFTMLMNPFLFLAFFYMAYAMYIFARAAYNKRTGSGYSLVSAAIMMSVFLIINLTYLGIIDEYVSIVMVGYLAFFFIQSLILSFRFAHSLKQAKVQAEEGLRAKSQFLSTMSHEIRTPLNAVIGMAHSMLRNKPREDQKEELGVMLFSAKNLLAIVNDILDYNKIEADKISFENIETDIISIAKNVVGGFKAYAAEKGIALSCEIDKQLDVTVMADPTRTTQVLNNLVNNAIKFTAKGSVTLNISVKERVKGNITLTISVRDTGIGIAAEKQKIIFEQFTQGDSSTSRSFGGTGLGLSICKSILEKQGSSLQLESLEGVGSKFYFMQTFTVCNKIEEIKPIAIVKELNQKPLKGIPILLVEDSEFNILVATKFLEDWGAEIDVAQNGLEAISKFDPARHQLILMDLHMPILDGKDATIQLRKQGATVPIIALTASMLDGDSKKVMASGANDIIVKPFEPDSLRKTLMHHLKLAS